MANKKLVAISYCCAFMFIYFINLAYALLSTSINNNFNTHLPQDVGTVNATMSVVSSFSSWNGSIVVAGIFAVVIAIIFIIMSSKSMASAI